MNGFQPAIACDHHCLHAWESVVPPKKLTYASVSVIAVLARAQKMLNSNRLKNSFQFVICDSLLHRIFFVFIQSGCVRNASMYIGKAVLFWRRFGLVERDELHLYNKFARISRCSCYIKPCKLIEPPSLHLVVVFHLCAIPSGNYFPDGN